MGIHGLLPFVEKACRQGVLSEFRGKSIAVDVSCLLHRGMFGCMEKLASGEDTDFYVGHVKKYVNVLLNLDCHVILVFDGQPLPAKKEVNESRRKSREKNQKLGEALMNQGLVLEAKRAFQQSATITREIVEKTIRAFKKIVNVDVLVAPYEADAQMAFLLQRRLVHAIVTEDTDLIAYGCELIIFKFNLNGTCRIYEKAKLPQCVCPAIRNRFDFRTFRRICILAGCDYLKEYIGGLQGVGLKKAELFFAKVAQTDLRKILPRVPACLGANGLRVTSEFVEEFIKAEKTFLYQVVYDPVNRSQIPLNEFSMSEAESSQGSNTASGSSCSSNSSTPSFSLEDDLWYAGTIVSAREAVRRALGNFDLERAQIQDEFILPSEANIPAWSIWSSEYVKTLRERELRFKKQTEEKFGAFAPKTTAVKREKRTLLLDDQEIYTENKENSIKKHCAAFSFREETSLNAVSARSPLVVKFSPYFCNKKDAITVKTRPPLSLCKNSPTTPL